MTMDHTAAIKELTEAIRHFGKAAGELAHVLTGCGANEIKHPRNHATLVTLAHALRDCSLSVRNCIDQAPATEAMT
jgi:hypothetical protein